MARAPGRTPRKRKRAAHMDGVGHDNLWRRVIDAGSGNQQEVEVNEQHLFDENADTETAFCRAATSTEERVSVGYYMEQRINGLDVGIVCEACKAFAPQFALSRSRDLEAEGMLDEAEEYRRLAETLRKETGQDPSGD